MGLSRFIARTREGIDVAALPSADLGHDMGRRTEAIEADAPALAGLFQRAPADQAGAH